MGAASSSPGRNCVSSYCVFKKFVGSIAPESSRWRRDSEWELGSAAQLREGSEFQMSNTRGQADSSYRASKLIKCKDALVLGAWVQVSCGLSRWGQGRRTWVRVAHRVCEELEGAGTLQVSSVGLGCLSHLCGKWGTM